MKLTLFTSNQPRHLALIERASRIAESVFVVQECNTVFPGQVQDFYARSPVMQRYFSNVIAAELERFGRPRFLPANVHQLALRMGDASRLELEALAPALEADHYVVFGASYLKGPLVDFLVERRCYNIHMGISPYYRGSSCNFWALYDRNPGLVGATVHLLSRGLDSGPMLFHALPDADEADPFRLGMRAVESAQAALVEALASGEILGMEPLPQDKQHEIRYSRHRDFTDAVAEEYLDRAHCASDFARALRERPMQDFLRPRVR